MKTILLANSLANSLISFLRMMNPTEETKGGKGIEIIPEILQGILQETEEETKLKEVLQTRHSRMNVVYTRTMSGRIAE